MASTRSRSDVGLSVNRSSLGRRSRRKGKAFELVVRDVVYDQLPGLTVTVRRSSQAERAYDADVVVEGPALPHWLHALWIECNHAEAPNPLKKLDQAERDAEAFVQRTGRARSPVVVWRKNREQTIWATWRLGTFGLGLEKGWPNMIVTCPWQELLSHLARRP